MSETHDPPRPDEHHSLREELEEAVEEVVEQVPEPIRWTVGKLIRLVLLALAGFVVLVVATAVLYVVNRTEWAARELAILVNQALVSRSNITIEIGDIKGNPLTGVRVLRPHVRFRDGRQEPFLDAEEMRLRYSAWDLATGAHGPIAIEIDHPLIHLQRGEDGRIRLPSWKSGSAARVGRGLDLSLKLHHAVVVSPDTALRAHGLDLDAVGRTGAEPRLDVRSLRWTDGPWGSVLTRGSLAIAKSDSTRLAIRELVTSDVSVRAIAAWKDSGDANVHLELDHLRWRWLHRVTGRDDVNVPGTGHIVVDAVGRRTLAGRFETDGTWDSLAVDARGGFLWRDGRLAISPLTAHSPAGDLSGGVIWTKSAWEIACDVLHGNPIHWSIIGIHNWPAGNLNGHFRYAVDTRHPKHAARLLAHLTDSEWTGWHADTGTVAVEFTPVGPDSFQVLAIRRGGSMRLRALTDDTGWAGEYEMTRFPLEEWPAGRASDLRGAAATGKGLVSSHRGDLQVTGALDGGVTDWLGIHAARWRMTGIKGSLLPVPDLDGDVKLEDLFFLTVHWDSAGVPIHVGDGRVALPRLRMAAGDTLVRLDGRAEWDASTWRLAADSCTVVSSQFAWTVDPPLEISGDAHSVHFDRVAARDGPARLVMEGRWAGKGGSYDWTARAERLDLSRLGFPRAWKLSGSADARLHITGPLEDPRWDVTGIARGAGMGTVLLDSLRLAVAGGPSRLDVRDAVASLGAGTVSMTGSVAGTARPWPDSLTAPGITRWLGTASRWNGQVRADGLPLERVAAWTPRAGAWKGRAVGTLEIGGRPDAPEVAWTLEARPLTYGDYQLDHATARGDYRDQRLEVSELKMTRGGVVSTVTGTMPLRLALGRRPVLPDQPMSWRLDLPNGDLALLPVFVPQIGAAAGRFDVEARMEGTPQHPRLTGTASIKDGRARMAGREEVLDQINADLVLSDSVMTVKKLSARQQKRRGAPGQVSVEGVVNLSGLALKSYRLDLHMNEFTAIQSGVYAALFDGNFVVTPSPRRVKGVVVPLVEGDVELRQAVVLFDFANQSQVEQVASATQQLYWLYRIQLHATDNLHWQPSDADIEFSADLSLEQTPDSLIVYGDMTSLRANRDYYYYLSNKFTMDHVNLTFDNVGGLDPKLDIAGSTEVQKSAGQPLSPGEADETGTIQVNITGRAKEPSIVLSNDRFGWDPPTILTALTYGPYRDVGSRTEAGGRLADQWVTRNLNRQLSPELSRIFQNQINNIELTRDSGGLFLGEGEVYVGGTVPLSRELSVRYRQRVPGLARNTGTANTTLNPFERDVEAQYRLNRFFYVSTEVTQRRGSKFGSTPPPEYNVGLKARWEY